MTQDSGNLSIDFLVGFTIFILAFIGVATMIPGILIDLNAHGVDYDAVAYRSGVILVEDPGEPSSDLNSWETFNDMQKPNITRFGLALSRDTPNILSQEKVDRFFCTTFVYPDDYHQKVIFGDYPYQFNISLLDPDNNLTRSVGDIIPPNHGYIRRLVKIKGPSNATIGASYIEAHHYYYDNSPSDNVSTHVFSILLNNTYLLNAVKDPSYQINPQKEQIMINITDLRSTIKNQANPQLINITLAKVEVYRRDLNPLGTYQLDLMRTFDTPRIDGNSTPQLPPVSVKDNVTLLFNDPHFISQFRAQDTSLYINLTFNLDQPGTFLNNSFSSPFNYDYSSANVTQPSLRNAAVEVSVW